MIEECDVERETLEKFGWTPPKSFDPESEDFGKFQDNRSAQFKAMRALLQVLTEGVGNAYDAGCRLLVLVNYTDDQLLALLEDAEGVNNRFEKEISKKEIR